MELKQRKRINNLPRFDTGADLSSMIGDNAPAGTGDLKYSPLNSYNGSTGSPSFNAGMSMQSVQGGFKMPQIKISPSDFANQIGGALSQSSKFTDSTSNDIRNFGSMIGGQIPGPYGQLVSGATSIAADTIGMWNYKHKTEDMNAEAGVSQNSIGGVGYTTQNYADTAKAYKDVKSTAQKNAVSMGFKGSAAGLAFGPIGAVVGGVLGTALGIFGGRKAMIRQKRINRNATMQTNATNRQQMSYADTENLQNRYYQNNRDTTGDIVYGANRGKDLKKRTIR